MQIRHLLPTCLFACGFCVTCLPLNPAFPTNMNFLFPHIFLSLSPDIQNCDKFYSSILFKRLYLYFAFPEDLSFEEAIEMADFIFEDEILSGTEEQEQQPPSAVTAATAASALPRTPVSVCDPIAVDVAPAASQNSSSCTSSSTAASRQRSSPRISPRTPKSSRIASPKTAVNTPNPSNSCPITADNSRLAAGEDVPDSLLTTKPNSNSSLPTAAGSSAASAAHAQPQAAAAANSSSGVVSGAGVSNGNRPHNLRPKRTLRTLTALKQQAKRRKKNTAIAAAAAGAASPAVAAQTAAQAVQRTLSSRRSSVTSNGGERNVYI